VTGDFTALGDRMKRYEATYRALLPPRTYTVLRVDIRAAHFYLRGAERPYDKQFMADMDSVAEALCKEITGSVFAYTQSDEISVLVADFAKPTTQAWFGGVVAKWTSIAASLATAELNSLRPDRRALFDARVFTISDPTEVANYFLWRQRDAVRNSISMAAQAYIPHKDLQGKSSDIMQEMLWDREKINWNHYSVGCKRGRTTVRKVGPRDTTYTDRRTSELKHVTAMRSWWETSGAEHFTADPGNWMTGIIPAIPSLMSATLAEV
jgi:tRNA(His) guanylyltransferase